MDDKLLPLLVVFSIGTLGYLLKARGKKRQLPLPPGPPSFPILGNVFDIPSSEPWIAYKQWAKEYGDVFRIRLLTQDAIVLNSLESAKALLEQRSQTYSSRPYLAANDMLGTSWITGFLPYGDTWKLHRKVFQQSLRVEGLSVHKPMQLKRARELVKNLFDSPSEYTEHVQTHATSIIMSATYGYHAAPRDDPIVDKIQTVMHTLSMAATPERSASFHAFPWFMHIPSWLPGASFQRTASSFRASLACWLEKPFEDALTKMSQGTLGPCFVGDGLARISKDDVKIQEVKQAIKEVAATSFAAASDTTASLMEIFILAMTLYPEVQKRAQKEIESVVGFERLPNFSDRPNLPYIDAVLRETLRWHPVNPLSLPRSNINDDTYGGYMIPKGTTIIPNVWAMAHDETKYTDPSTFNPDRFFGDDGKLNDDDVSYVFGFGRRICIGINLTDGSVWSAMANLLAAFVFQGPDDGAGQPVPRFTTGLNSHPEPFKVNILPRFDAEKLATLLGAEC